MQDSACQRSFWKGVARWLLLGSIGAWLQPVDAAPLGDPPVVRHAIDRTTQVQVFSVVQDRRGVVHLGVSDGLLSYDGERWVPLPLGNGDLVRSLALGDDGRVLVGGYGAFGYLGTDAQGQDHFIDLSDKAEPFLQGRELADIWDVLSTDEGVWFRAVRDLFLWDPASDRLRHWHHPGRFGVIERDPAGRAIVQFRGEGFRVYEEGQWLPLPETAALTELVFLAVPVPGAPPPPGASTGGGLLTLGTDGRWHRLIGDRLWPQPMPDGLPASSRFENGLGLADGSLALAGSDGLLYLVDPLLHSWRSLPIDAGFLSGIVPAQGGGLLIAADGALYHVDWPGPWTLIDARHGLRGNLAAVAEWNGARYVLSAAGAALLQAEPGQPIALQQLAWPADSMHALQPIDADRALVSENHRIVLLNGQQQRALSEELVYPRELYPARLRPGRIYVATELGLRHVDVNGASVVLSAPFPDGREIRVLGVAETAVDRVWFGSVRHGLWRVALDSAGTISKAEAVPLPGATGTEEPVLVSRLGEGRVYVSSRRGYYQIVDEQLQAVDLGALPAGAAGDVLQLVQGSDGSLWGYGASGIYRRPPGGEWAEEGLRHLRRGLLVGHHVETDGGLTLVASQQLLLYRRATVAGEQPASKAPQVALRSVMQVFPDGSQLALALDRSQPPALSAGDFALSFQYALPELSVPGGARYQARLLGYNEPWSTWSRSGGFSYSRLRPGEYQLELRALDAAGRESSIVPYAFRIEPPWYQRSWFAALALLLLLVLGVQALRWFVRRRLRRLDLDRQQLAALVDERTRELASANRQLEQIAHLDGLTGIANRRRLDEFLECAWQQGGGRLAVLAIDVDHFKAYNDSHGHLAGDELLKALVPILADAVRDEQDLLARFGGEEFLVVLPHLDTNQARAVAERLRQRVDAAGLGTTVSIGVASGVAGHGEMQALLRAADEALYAAKEAGRNRVCCAAG